MDDGVDALKGGAPVGVAIDGADDGGVGIGGVGAPQGGAEDELGQGVETLR